jgi:hypothetical protein
MSVAHQVGLNQGEAGVASFSKATAGELYKDSETTRLLCASAYLNGKFRDEVIKSCVEDHYRAIGPSFGVDMATVVRHCCNARRKLNSRELWLLVPVVVAAIVIINNLQADVFTPSDVLGEIGILFLVYLAAFGICLWFKSRARNIVTRHFLRGNFAPEALLSDDSTAIEHVRAADGGNVVIYSGFTPFVGSGEEMAGWSFALDLRKQADSGSKDEESDNKPGTVVPISKEPEDVQEISLDALYNRVAQDIGKLQLERVTLEDKLYVNGRDIRDDKRFLDRPLARPRNLVDDAVVARAMLEQSEKQLRHYRCIRVVDWSGELVLSIFLRFSKLSNNLFVEASYFLLTPVGEGFREVDRLSAYFDLGRFCRTIFQTAVTTPFITVFAPIVLLGRIRGKIERWSEHRREKKQILNDPTFDYGASFSFRQWASPNQYRRYFQKLDKEMYFKVLEKNILDSVLTFLEENNVDVSELRQRQSMILNNGVIVSGGSMTAGNLSVGEGAKIKQVTQKISQVAAKAATAGKQVS